MRVKFRGYALLMQEWASLIDGLVVDLDEICDPFAYITHALSMAGIEQFLVTYDKILNE